MVQPGLLHVGWYHVHKIWKMTYPYDWHNHMIDKSIWLKKLPKRLHTFKINGTNISIFSHLVQMSHMIDISTLWHTLIIIEFGANWQNIWLTVLYWLFLLLTLGEAGPDLEIVPELSWSLSLRPVCFCGYAWTPKSKNATYEILMLILNQFGLCKLFSYEVIGAS